MTRQTNNTFSRRGFVAAAGALGTGFALPPLVRAASPMSRLQHVSVGCSGMAWADLNQLTNHKQLDLFGVCDVDERTFAQVRAKFPDVKTFTDHAELIDAAGDRFDSANVTVPDHMHATIATAMLKAGKHVYCQKPLTQWVGEARDLSALAATLPVTTQMGIQVHSSSMYRIAVNLVQEGRIGRIREVHAWSHKNWGGGTRPAPAPVPDGFHWDRWLGVAPKRPYAEKVYHPSEWRRWLDFGTGTFGDMGCHIYDPVFAALGVDSPSSVRSAGPAPEGETWPTSAEVQYVYPGTRYTLDPVQVTWYDGGRMPPERVLKHLGSIRAPQQGSIFIGEAGAMLVPHVAAPRLLPAEKFRGIRYPRIATSDHWMQFVDAALGKGETLAPFSYSGPLTESVLLGGIAVRFPGKQLEWNAASMTFPNMPAADGFVRRG